jgi:hypothetical protein
MLDDLSSDGVFGSHGHACGSDLPAELTIAAGEGITTRGASIDDHGNAGRVTEEP